MKTLLFEKMSSSTQNAVLTQLNDEQKIERKNEGRWRKKCVTEYWNNHRSRQSLFLSIPLSLFPSLAELDFDDGLPAPSNFDNFIIIVN